jgi:hypothetical protein
MGIHIYTKPWDAFMKYAADMGSGAMICIPSLTEIGCRHSEVDRAGFTDTHTHTHTHSIVVS